MSLSVDRRQTLPEEDVRATIELRLNRQHLLQVRIVGEGDELLEDVPRHHAGLLAEDGEELSLAAVVAQKLIQLFGHDGGLQFKTNLFVI